MLTKLSTFDLVIFLLTCAAVAIGLQLLPAFLENATDFLQQVDEAMRFGLADLEAWGTVSSGR